MEKNVNKKHDPHVIISCQMSLPLPTGTQVDNISWTLLIINVIQAVTFLYKKIIQFSFFMIGIFILLSNQ